MKKADFRQTLGLFFLDFYEIYANICREKHFKNRSYMVFGTKWKYPDVQTVWNFGLHWKLGSLNYSTLKILSYEKCLFFFSEPSATKYSSLLIS